MLKTTDTAGNESEAQETVSVTVATPPDTTRPIISSGNTITVESVEGAAVPAGGIYTATSNEQDVAEIHYTFSQYRIKTYLIGWSC